jgi:proteasome accessory factor A
MKVIGADFELANALAGAAGDVREAAERLLDEIPGFPRAACGGPATERGRRFLAGNGGSAYIDLDHLEINLPEHTRAADHAAHVHAGLRIAETARQAASRKLPGGGRINVLAAVSDGRQSWGHHLNVLVRRRLFRDLFHHRPHVTGFLAAHLATATLYTGHGQAGAANGRAACDYQLSQRADWFEDMTAPQTTHQRPLLNTRDEPHAGEGLARLHLIFFDNVLSPVANFLKAGTTQLVLAMAEAGRADPRLLLYDALGSALEVSRDLSLKRPLPMAERGRSLTAVEVQRGLLERAREFVADGGARECVPDAEDILACWDQTLELLARRCDWALKYLILDRRRGRHGGSWQSDAMRCLDLLFSSLDPAEGMFWQMAAAGQVEDMPAPGRVERFVREPPDDSRAYLRAHLLRRFGGDVEEMDWGHIRFRVPLGRHWSAVATLAMPDPAGFNRAAVEPVLRRCRTLHDAVEALGDMAAEGSR